MVMSARVKDVMTINVFAVTPRPRPPAAASSPRSAASMASSQCATGSPPTMLPGPRLVGRLQMGDLAQPADHHGV
jgi:hypothetical protein